MTLPAVASNECPNGHLYNGSNVVFTPDGGRRCLACRRAAGVRSSRRRRAERAKPVVPVSPDTRWREQAVCQGADPSLFDPLSKLEVTECAGTPMGHDRVQAAVSYCRRCPVREQCHAWAQATGAQGVWGGEYLSREGRLKKGAA